MKSSQTQLPAPIAAPRVMVVPPTLVPESRGVVAMLSHVSREGEWILPRLFRAIAVMGNVEIDLTHAQLGSGTSEIQLRSIMGSITVLVPPDVRVECELDAFLASSEVAREVQSTASPDAPLVRITGSAFMASIEVKVIDPNAPGWIEKLRARWDAAAHG